MGKSAGKCALSVNAYDATGERGECRLDLCRGAEGKLQLENTLRTKKGHRSVQWPWEMIFIPAVIVRRERDLGERGCTRKDQPRQRWPDSQRSPARPISSTS